MQRSLKQDTKEALKCKPRLTGHSGESLEDPDVNRNADSKGLVQKVSEGNDGYQKVG